MLVRLYRQDGTPVAAERDRAIGWYVVEGARPNLGDSLDLDGIPRKVVMVMRLPNGRSAIHLLPDFAYPGCEDCGLRDVPPTPEECRMRCRSRQVV